MLKVMLMLDCDSCRRLFRLAHVASEDRIAWHIHNGTVIEQAAEEEWEISACRNFQYCSSCVEKARTPPR